MTSSFFSFSFQTKDELRRWARTQRQRTPLAIRKTSALALASVGASFLAALPVSQNPHRYCAGYATIRGEIDVFPLMAALKQQGWSLALPIMEKKDHPLEFGVFSDISELTLGDFGVLSPPATALRIIPDVMLIPLLAFDRLGFRLGYGGGYYDRTLARLRQKEGVIPLALGVGYAFQRFSKIPHNSFDQRMDWILTERGVLKC